MHDSGAVILYTQLDQGGERSGGRSGGILDLLCTGSQEDLPIGFADGSIKCKEKE